MNQEMDKLYGKINDAIVSCKKNPYKVKEYQEKKRKRKKKKINYSHMIGSLSILIF